ncbi:MAG TPA: hypothetical protein VMR21_11740 [Vicinamibacteria bacterium]|nr:hypothetical protein [Vicinamibacteria bacterium]
MPFPCPACRATVPHGPEAWALRCPSCGAVIRSRPLDDAGGGAAAFEVEVAGRPETRTRVEVPWTADQAARLRRWLLWSTLLTLGLVLVLFAAARWAAG